MSVQRAVLTVLSYVVATFGVQGVSHFVVNTEHYASISIMRTEPVFSLGFTAMLIQGFLFAVLFPLFNREGSPIRNAITFAWAMGAILGSYIALAEAGKYAVTDIARWLTVETGAAAIQFTLFGVLLGLIHGHRAVQNVAGQDDKQ